MPLNPAPPLMRLLCLPCLLALARLAHPLVRSAP